MSRTPTTRIAAAAIALALIVGTALVLRARGSDSATGGRPNVVVILTDDQTLEEMRVMESTRALLGDQGTTFSHYYASFPNCCPSRATYYTGQYAHNTGVLDNVAPHGGYQKLKTDQTINTALQNAGYYTAHIGKYLNGWGFDGKLAAPPGWSHWFGLIDPSTYNYFDYSVSDDGTKRTFGKAESDYSTDVLGAETVETIGEAAKSGKPFFVSFTPLAPHVENAEKSNLRYTGYQWPFAKPAPRHAKSFANEQLPKTPSYNEVDVSAKPNFIRELSPITKTIESLATKSYQLELETLKATDEWVGKIVQSLKDNGVYDNTFVIFTSDNGLFHGEHRITNGKFFLYEPAVHLPLLIAGPGVPKGVVAEQPVVSVDLAATILAVTRVPAKAVLDGRNVLPLAHDPALGQGRAVLLENNRGGAPLTTGLHTERFVYLESADGTKELYDLAADPDQLQNLTGSPAYRDTEANLAARLAVARACAGATCEGSDAGNNDVPDGATAPAADPNTVAANTIPPSAEALSAFETESRVQEGRDVLIGLFELTPKETTCAAKALTDHADLLETEGLPLLQSNRALVNAIGVSKSCIGPVRFAAGLGAFVPLLTDGRLASDAAVCVGRAMAKLDDTDLARVFEYLLNPADDPDIEGKAKAASILTLCKVDPASILPPP